MSKSNFTNASFENVLKFSIADMKESALLDIFEMAFANSSLSETTEVAMLENAELALVGIF